MARRPSRTLTEGEQRLMNVLWARGPSTVSEVVADLEPPVPAYTSVLTVFGILERKGFVRRRKSAKAHVYRATVDREAATESVVAQLLARWFDDSPRALMLSLLSSEKLTDEEYARLRTMIEERP